MINYFVVQHIESGMFVTDFKSGLFVFDCKMNCLENCAVFPPEKFDELRMGDDVVAREVEFDESGNINFIS